MCPKTVDRMITRPSALMVAQRGGGEGSVDRATHGQELVGSIHAPTPYWLVRMG